MAIEHICMRPFSCFNSTYRLYRKELCKFCPIGYFTQREKKNNFFSLLFGLNLNKIALIPTTPLLNNTRVCSVQLRSVVCSKRRLIRADY
ncbi:hypothetical protein BpHYR1_024950 [Brachionus plicatilis]|uniref:Uncharacterized protein n=1 Tax=Brachionus plicatilis TaxID=10195 RepID=A0A3M7PG10_BRAPC|nr:hypothetical protein BpHYR1_024950 [Brachionus plicatilis]